jgi:hypothetical protein
MSVYLGDDAAEVVISTIDSRAWALHSGTSDNARLTGDYEDTIRAALQRCDPGGDIAEALTQLEHVIVDEAQDIVGVRADLVRRIIELLPKDCGVTVFCDEAQAIYGFSDDSDGDGIEELPSSNFVEDLREASGSSFDSMSLTFVHRTDSPDLLKLFTAVRRKVLDGKVKPTGLQGNILQDIRSLAGEFVKGSAPLTREDMELFRRRGETLEYAQFLDVPYRLRLSGFPPSLPSWIGTCLHDWTERTIANDDFTQLWESRISSIEENVDYLACTDAWKRLMKLAGRGPTSVEMTALRRVLSRPVPPPEMLEPDYGLDGPIIGTIHASKGREGAHVILHVTDSDASIGQNSNVLDEAEEARVLFVGSTRAKRKLELALEPQKFHRSVNGRSWRGIRGAGVMIEVGKAEDIDTLSLVSKSSQPRSACRGVQNLLIERASQLWRGDLKREGEDLDYRYRLRSDERPIALLNKRFNEELWKAWKANGLYMPTPGKLNHVNVLGSRTIVLPNDAPNLSNIHEPWATSGIFLAPRIASFVTAKAWGKKQ